jgi:hypothetical protein
MRALLYRRQWNMRAVHADSVWMAGYLGWDKARVAIIDTGIDSSASELAGLIDTESSASFADDDAEAMHYYPGWALWGDRYSHGTSHAVMIASHGDTLAGFLQGATLFAVKTGNGEGGEAKEGLPTIYWAIKHRADVMSFGGGVKVDTVEQRGLYEAFNRAFEYAWRKGVVSVVPAGDNRINRDAFGSDTVGMPCDAPHVMCVASTAPTSAASDTGAWGHMDAQPANNNYGHDITVAAPGGTGATNRRIWLRCSSTPDTVPPIVTSPACTKGNPIRGPGLYSQGAGSSWAAAAVSALAAMLVTKYGHNHADLIRQRIIDTADDCGAPGYDVHYGWGRVNFARAMDVGIRRGRNPDATPVVQARGCVE